MRQSSTVAIRHAAVADIREAAARSLARVLGSVEPQSTERAVCDAWRTALAHDAPVTPEGWYVPPPGGFSVLVGDTPHYGRLRFHSLRDRSSWPDDRLVWPLDAPLFAYCSPIHRDTAMIGDFQVTLYQGTNTRIRQHLADAYGLTVEIADHAAVGMPMRELHTFAEQRAHACGLTNESRSTTSHDTLTNIGHTVPWADGTDDLTARQTIVSGNASATAAIIRRSLTLITSHEHLRIAPNCAFTVEPQLTSREGLRASFHIIVSFLEGVKRIHGDVAALWRLFGMDSYMPTSAAR